MPLRGGGHSGHVRDEAPYFKSLAELDTWFARPHDKLSGVSPYQPRPYVDEQSDSGGKLLVCHDYKGGYTESPSGLCYTFNFWSLCDTFVYFSHNRFTVPPSGWVNVAHKQGTRILGTLIFEHTEAIPDCLQLVVGRPGYIVTNDTIPVSKRYAVLLAELAHQRGFDGYLLNFECVLSYKTNHARALAAWMLLLRAELRARIGPHAQVVWYDSIVYNGWVAHQNRLNGFNLPFFLASDTFFTNYWWSPNTQASMIQYFADLGLPAPSSNASIDATSSATTKTLQSIYSGIDVWPGRGQYGDGGFCCYRSTTYTSPWGFSTAIFAPGWTWEAATTNPEQNWNEWWENERKLWFGPLKPGEIIPVPESPEGPFKPMTAFFRELPPPDPSNLVFYTHFSPGVGYSWFVEGKKVLDTKEGWTDVDKQGSIGNLVWPWPSPSWRGARQEEVAFTSSTALDMTDGYNGGNTLKLTLTYAASKPEPAIESIWLPVQSFAVTTQESFEARVVYKTTVDVDVDVDAHIYAESLPREGNNSAGFIVGQATVSNLARGWTQQTVNFTSTSTQNTASVAIGFLVGIKPKHPSAKNTFSLSLGQLAVYPTPPPEVVSVGTPSITWAQFSPAPHAADTLEGVLTWDVSSIFDPTNALVDDEESTTPAWLLQDTPAYRFPTFVYFNIYVAPLAGSTDVDPANAAFIGTTGLDGRANRFYVEKACFPPGWDQQAGVRFYVQGVTDRGEVSPWERCATVDRGAKIA